MIPEIAVHAAAATAKTNSQFVGNFSKAYNTVIICRTVAILLIMMGRTVIFPQT